MDTATPCFVLPLRVTWENTDTAGYIHNSVVFRWFEQGELEWFRILGIHWKAFPEFGFPRVRVQADFLRPLHFDDLCDLRTGVARVRAASYELWHEVCLAGQVAVRGRVAVCCVAGADGKPRLLPDALRDVLRGLCPEP
jgi:acyl-CoA thioester hydrolase